MKKIIFFLAAVVLLACSKEEEPIPYDPSNPIVGVWQQVSRHTQGYDTRSGETIYDNVNETASKDYLMLMANKTIYLGAYSDENKRMNIGTYEYQGDSIFFNSSTFVGQKRQAVLELAREVMRLEYISDDGSEDGTMDVVRVTYRRIEN